MELIKSLMGKILLSEETLFPTSYDHQTRWYEWKDIVYISSELPQTLSVLALRYTIGKILFTYLLSYRKHFLH